MDAITSAELKRLREIKLHIERIVKEFGLNFREQKFDIISSDRMIEMMAYGLPVNFSHWSHGRDYEILRTQFENSGGGLPLEVVFNFKPTRAYLLKTDPVALKITTMAHVYAHNDFFTESCYFKDTWETMLTFASSARDRLIEYERSYGTEAVEKTIEDFKAISSHVDPDLARRYEDWSEDSDGGEKPAKVEESDPFHKAFPKKIKPKDSDADPDDQLKLPEEDMLYFIVKHAPLKPFQKDIGNVIWEQARYFSPQMRTKVMNEGWAGYWHHKIMLKLLEEKLINEEEYSAYLVWDSRVFANDPRGYNPYLVGRAIWQSIEERWDKGQFGEDWEKCVDSYNKENWDKKLGQGRQKIFEVRRAYSDRFFVEHFLTKEIIDDLKLYIYGYDNDELIIIEDDWEVIKKMLVEMHTNFGAPFIIVSDDPLIKEKGVLVLKHVFNGFPLDNEYRDKTMEHIASLWQKTVILRTKLVGRDGPHCVTFSFNQNKGHKKEEVCKSGYCRH